MITAAELERFMALRQRVMEHITHEVTVEHNGPKAYEGTFSITFPSWHHEQGQRPFTALHPEEVTRGYYRIELHCYLLGPARHYNWDGATFGVALENCEADMLGWIAQAKEDWAS